MKTFTVGFLFAENFAKVLLMHKNRPDWQKGFLGGIGGRIEGGETSVECMMREMEEETSLKTGSEDWRMYATMESENKRVDFYVGVYEGELTQARTMTDETVEWVSTSPLPNNVLPDLSWLIPLAIDVVKGGRIKEVKVTGE